MIRKMTLSMASVLALAMVAGAAQAQDGAPAAGKPAFEGLISRLDTDGDGQISRAEFEAPRLARLKAMDPNGDGVVTLEEMKAYAVEQATKRAEAMADRRFKMLDVDGDGKVTAAEALIAQERRGRHGAMDFERLDKNKDGLISAEELAQAKPKSGPHGEGKRRGHGLGHGDHGHDHGRGHGHEQDRAPKGDKPSASEI